MITGSQSLKAYEESKRFLAATPANCPERVFKRDAKAVVNGISQKDITVKPNDAYLFYVDEEPREGISLNFTPNGKNFLKIGVQSFLDFGGNFFEDFRFKNIKN